MSADDGPGRLEGEALLPLTRAARKFGIGTCALCSARFTRRRHGQKFCSPTHKQEAANRRAGEYSTDPRWVARRERKRRLETRRDADTTLKASPVIPYSGKGVVCQKYRNKNNDLQGVFLASSMGISGLGASREDFREILLFELWNVPGLSGPGQAIQDGSHEHTKTSRDQCGPTFGSWTGR
jgi:hypothetical protein